MNAVARWIDAQYSRHSHLDVTTPDGRDGFALVGGFRARHRFGALYLPEVFPHLRTRVAIHRALTADDGRRLLARYGLVVFCGESAPAALASELLNVPVMLDMEIPTPEALEGPRAPWGKSAKSNISRIRRGDFTFDIVHDVATADRFYQAMYLPSMRGRHDREAYVDSRRAILQSMGTDGTELLRIFQHDRWIAATLNSLTEDGYRLHRVGWLHGDEHLLRAGAVAATYWFSFQRALALGRHRILLGSTLPHLEDGVFLYKSHWGGRLCHTHRDFGAFHLLLDPSNPVCRRFLRGCSMIVKAPGGRLVVFSGRTPAETKVSADVLKGIARWYLLREQPLAVPEVVADEVPRNLRPWVTALEPVAPSP